MNELCTQSHVACDFAVYVFMELIQRLHAFFIKIFLDIIVLAINLVENSISIKII